MAGKNSFVCLKEFCALASWGEVDSREEAKARKVTPSDPSVQSCYPIYTVNEGEILGGNSDATIKGELISVRF